MMLHLTIVSAILSLASALRVAPLPRASSLRAAPLPRATCRMDLVDQRPPEDEPPDETPAERKQRLEELGRKVAAEASYLDTAPIDDGGLMAEFNSRLDKEGGATIFKAKTSVSALGEGAKDTAQAAKDKALDLADAAGGLTSGLSEQQKNIGKIVLGLIAFQILIGAIGSAFGGGGSGGYSV